jgi:hypothetical protein
VIGSSGNDISGEFTPMRYAVFIWTKWDTDDDVDADEFINSG